MWFLTANPPVLLRGDRGSAHAIGSVPDGSVGSGASWDLFLALGLGRSVGFAQLLQEPVAPMEETITKQETMVDVVASVTTAAEPAGPSEDQQQLDSEIREL